MKINVIGFYKIKEIKSLTNYQYLLKKKLLKNLIRGTIILSPEGINGTISGKKKEIKDCISFIKKKLMIKKFDSINHQLKKKPRNEARLYIHPQCTA